MKALRGLLVSVVTSFIIVACSGGSPESPPGGVSTTPTPQAVADLPAETVAQMKTLIAEKAARTPAQKKISS